MSNAFSCGLFIHLVDFPIVIPGNSVIYINLTLVYIVTMTATFVSLGLHGGLCYNSESKKSTRLLVRDKCKLLEDKHS